MRTEQEIFDELYSLCTSPGYVHAFASLCFRDTVVGYGEEMTSQNLLSLYTPSTLIRTELTTLMGLMIRQPIDFTLPRQDIIENYIDRSDALMDELHQAMIAATMGAYKDCVDPADFNPFTTADSLREPIFYSAESAYPHQYRDFAPTKYSADKKWLEDNRGFDMKSASALIRALTDTVNDKLTNTVKTLAKHPKDKFTILPGYTFSSSELARKTGMPRDLIERILTAFTAPVVGCNGGFTSLHAFNAAYAFPFIRKGDDEFVLFQQYGVTEALYDAPFYWMSSDKSYASTAFEHRGDFTEDFSFERLQRVFGTDRVFKNVEIVGKKGVTLGEIDVLILFGDQAVIVQAKSKKLTLEARNGNDLRLRGDFKAAVQDAVDQAISCATLLCEPSVNLRCRDGSVPHPTTEIKTAYPVTVVADHYPALAFQSRQLISFSTTKKVVAPLVLDVFSLDTITEFLSSPLRFLSYLRLRAKSGDAFMANHENTLLSYHLKQNLWQDDFDLMMIGDDISADLDVAMAARRDGIPGAKTPTGILTAFVDTPFSEIIAQIEHEAEPVPIALGFLLLELGGSTVKSFNRNVERVRDAVTKDGKSHNLAMGLGERSAGLTLHCNNLPTDEASKRLYRHCEIRKYGEKAEEWFGLVIRPDGSLHLAVVLNNPWKFDPEKEVKLTRMPNPKNRSGKKRKKPGRNDPCPCGSGKKFKRCHGGGM